MSDVTVTLSDRLVDIDRVIAVVHEGFVEAGFLEPQPSGRRVIPHYLTPGAAFILARVDGTDAGSCTVIPDGPYGMPSEHAFGREMAEARESGARLVEVGSLAVVPSQRAASRRLVTHLMATAVRVLVEADVDTVITVAPEQERFYAATFGFRKIAGPVLLYGAPAILVRTSSSEMLEHLAMGTAISRRTMFGLVADPAPDWLIDRRVARVGRLVPG